MLTACSDGGEAEKRAEAVRAAPDGPLDCERLLPPELREANFSGARVESGAPPSSLSALCRLTGGGSRAEIGYTCVGDPERALERARASAQTGVRDLRGIAADAFVLSYGPSAPHATLFLADDDTSCWLSASVGVTRDHGAIARALAEALTPEAIAADR